MLKESYYTMLLNGRLNGKVDLKLRYMSANLIITGWLKGATFIMEGIVTCFRLARCECLIVPCCNGKMDPARGYPRSAAVSALLSEAEYAQLCAAADDLGHYAARCAVELDRALWVREGGAAASCHKMEPVTATPKHLLIYCHFNST